MVLNNAVIQKYLVLCIGYYSLPCQIPLLSREVIPRRKISSLKIVSGYLLTSSAVKSQRVWKKSWSAFNYGKKRKKRYMTFKCSWGRTEKNWCLGRRYYWIAVGRIKPDKKICQPESWQILLDRQVIDHLPIKVDNRPPIPIDFVQIQQ